MVKASMSYGGFHPLKKENGEYRANLGKRFQCDTLLVKPQGFNDRWERPDNYQELEKIMIQKDLSKIFRKVKVVYLYSFGVKKEENIDLQYITVNQQTTTDYQLWLNFMIEENSILPYKKAYLVVESDLDFEFQAFIENEI
jgi:hypothetical protein